MHTYDIQEDKEAIISNKSMLSLNKFFTNRTTLKIAIKCYPALIVITDIACCYFIEC